MDRHARNLVDIVEIRHVSIQLKRQNLLVMAVKPEDPCNTNVMQGLILHKRNTTEDICLNFNYKVTAGPWQFVAHALFFSF